MQHKETRKYFFGKRFFFLTLIIFFLASCKESKEIKNVSIHRFEQALFSANQSQNVEQYLLGIEKDYAPMFTTTLENTEYLNVVKEFINDKEMKNVYNMVMSQYPNLNFLEEELSLALSEIKQIKEDTLNSKIYTLIVGPAEYSQAFQNRILVYPEFSAISIDLYSIEKLANCTGQKLRKKNNLIKQFQAEWPHAEVRKLTKDDVNVVRSLAKALNNQAVR